MLTALLLTAVAAQGAPHRLPDPVRVACLGDSITAGARLDRPDRHGWPAQLGAMLGEAFEVRAFGAGGHTLRRTADRPYLGCARWAEALEWRPAVAIVVLGTNDTVATEARPNWPDERWDWAAEAAALAEPLRAAGARVIVATPPNMHADRDGLTDDRAADLRSRTPRLREISSAILAGTPDAPYEVLDLTRALRPRDVADGVHPEPFGHERIALRVDMAIRAPTLDGTGADSVRVREKLRDLGVEGPIAHPSTWPRPSAEYRGKSAGWGGGDWFDAFERTREAAREAGPTPVVFLGDSITQGLTGHGERRAREGGERAIDAWFGDVGAIGLGLSGDRTEHVLHRIAQGALDPLDPRVVVLQIGVNNLNAARHSADETAAGIEAVVGALLERFPRTRVLVCGPFTAGVDPKSGLRRAADGTHARLAELELGPRVERRDLRPLFESEDGALRSTMSRDGIHVTEEGRRAWLEAIAPTVRGWL